MKEVAPENIEIHRLLALAVQLTAVLAVAVMFRIELERGFAVVALLVLIGFIVHSRLPLPVRTPFFLLLTFVALIVLLGSDGLWVIGLGLALIGLCHLPIPWGARTALVVMAGACLAAIRIGMRAFAWSNAVIPVLASMFMFRIILYLYDLKNDNTPANPWKRLAYFFMLPNVCFPLFPVVDYKTFIDSYYDTPAKEMYQKGLNWILLGLIHLLLYRFVYHLLPRVDASNIGVLGVIAFLTMTYGLYLRVSGLFHLIAGILCLFGFNLPVTNNYYYLSSSFTDLWRRINIYWKDFMTKLVFYPIFLGNRRGNVKTRLAVATLIVFVATWFLHSYQWFWLEGQFPITGTDIAFWGVLGAVLAINTVWEAHFGRRRNPAAGWSFGLALGKSLRTLGVFLFMAALWTLWDSGSFTDWSYRILRARESDPIHWVILGTVLGSLVLAGTAGQWLSSRDLGIERVGRLAWRHAPVAVPVVATGLLVLTVPAVHATLGQTATRVLSKVRSTSLNALDLKDRERGYYEALTRSTQFGPVPLVGEVLEDENWVNFRATPAARPTNDIRGWELAPNVEMIHKGASFQTNSLGLRDKEYSLEKPGGFYRIAVVGSSHVMGSGVDNAQTFENVLEGFLNTRKPGEYEGYEVLNFGVGGYGPLQTLHVVERIVPEFKPDAVVYFVLPGEQLRTLDRLSELEEDFKLESSHAHVAEIMDDSDAHFGLPASEFMRRMGPYGPELLRWTYQRKMAAIREIGAVGIFVLMPHVDWYFSRSEKETLSQILDGTGAIVIDLSDVYYGKPAESLSISKSDNHPNSRAHALIAARLYEEFAIRLQ